MEQLRARLAGLPPLTEEEMVEVEIRFFGGRHDEAIKRAFGELRTARAKLAEEKAEHLADVKELRADHDNVKSWCVALYAHVCRLTGARASSGPQEIVKLAESFLAEMEAKCVRCCTVVAQEYANQDSPPPGTLATIIARVMGRPQ